MITLQKTLTKIVACGALASACHATVIHGRCGFESVDSICGSYAVISIIPGPNFINYFHVLECQHVVISF